MTCSSRRLAVDLVRNSVGSLLWLHVGCSWHAFEASPLHVRFIIFGWTLWRVGSSSTFEVPDFRQESNRMSKRR